MTKGQRALAVVTIYPEVAKVRRSGFGSVQITGLGVSSAGLSHARTVIQFAPELAAQCP